MAVGKVHEYEDEFDATDVGLLPELVQAILALLEFVTVHDITPAGAAPPEGPVTVAVSVVVPPSAGEAEEVIVTVGVT